ncbi:flagellar basal body rod protein FlgB [Pseudooceanicola sp. C21-150M6]|uniref:flagellar basal body rod protein FlgB n=1 Tax=Pseudooceanicola sp. C21-150M6 TaxID=3434355 RepID=UPI003D7F4C56
MRLSDMSFFNLAHRRMNWLGTRQQVIAQNVANADTPGFKARDVAPFADALAGSRAGGLKTTNTRHISGSGATDGIRTLEDEGPYESSLDGNSVALEQQAIKAAEISENYRMASQLYRKGHDLLTLAATGIR